MLLYCWSSAYLVCSLLSETLFCGDKVLVDNVVDVWVVGVKELLHLAHLRVVQEQAQMLQPGIYEFFCSYY